MKNFIFLLLLSITEVSFASNIDIKNAKIGSILVTDYSLLRYQLSVVGHASVVINEYENDDRGNFVIAAEMNGMFRLSHSDNIAANNYLGHFRAVSKNYTFKERDLIKEAALEAYKSEPDYEFINLYTYDWDFDHNNSTPYSINIVPTDFRCDGLAEWAVEVATNPINPSKSDGFYQENIFWKNQPLTIKYSPVDKIGIPDKPILSLVDDGVKIEFPEVSGAWSEALYAVYKKDLLDNNISKDDIIYCGSNDSNSYIDDKKENSTYYYFLKVGERTADCDKMSDFSKLSEYSTLERFVVSDNNKTIVDTKTDLMWDNIEVPTSNWIDSYNICRDLQLESYEEWSLPTISELKSIVDLDSNTHVYEGFTKLDEKPYGYWSSNKIMGYNKFMPWLGLEEQASVLNFNNNSISLWSTKYQMNLICVRSL